MREALGSIGAALHFMGHATNKRATLTDGVFAVANALEGVAHGAHAIANAIAAMKEQPK